ncbi:hypothetical protein PCE1_004501 [Barthelona sp. PCE]
MKRIYTLALLLVLLFSFVICEDTFESEAFDTEEVPEGPSFSPEQVINGDKFEFQSNTHRLLEILVRSLYSNREIFLREVVSNAADALERARFLSVENREMLEVEPEFEIRIKADPEAKTIVIEDTGVGMSREGLKDNLGTIAHSGTQAFMDNFAENGDLSAIGQFGVGFYSVFLVADLVDVHSKNMDDEQYVWQSTAEDEFTIARDESDDITRGSRIVLHLKDDAHEFLDADRLFDLANHYSEFIQFPIKVWTSREVEVEVEAEEVEVEEETEEAEEKKPETVTETEWYWKRVNPQPAIWTRDPKTVEEEEYLRFYRSFGGSDEGSYLGKTHFKVEGEYEFSSLLYVPDEHASNLIDEFEKSKIRLYVKKVLISDTEALLPKWLNFLRGVVDSDDLPLNVNREMIQGRVIKSITRKLTSKSLNMFSKMAKKEEEKFDRFLEKFGKFLKIGMIEDAKSRTKISKLLRFHSSNSEEKTSLADYIERMAPNQDSIYYVTSESVEMAERLPYVEGLVTRGFEVLYLLDPLDEAALQNLRTFDDVEIISAASESASFTSSGDSEFVKFVEELLPVSKVEFSENLVSSPSALSHADTSPSANMERLIKQQRQLDPNFQETFDTRRILLLNPNHPIVKGFEKRYNGADIEIEEEKESLTDIAHLLYDSAMLASGYDIEDHQSLAQRINTVLSLSLNVEDETVDVDSIKENIKAEQEAALNEMESEDADEDDLDLDEFDIDEIEEEEEVNPHADDL